MESTEELLIFMHMPKTGGSTLRGILGKQYPDLFYGPGGGRLKIIEILSSLSDEEAGKIKCIYGHIPLGIEKFFNRPFKYITILRNPIDRILSLYYYLLYQPTIEWIDNINLKEFIEMDNLEDKIHGPHNLYTRFLSYNCQLNDFRRNNENLRQFVLGVGNWKPDLEQAKFNLNKYFIVAGITELFDQSLLLMKKELGWTDINYKKVNVNRKRPHKEDLPDNIINLIREKNEIDMELYKYVKRNLLKTLLNNYPNE